MFQKTPIQVKENLLLNESVSGKGLLLPRLFPPSASLFLVIDWSVSASLFLFFLQISPSLAVAVGKSRQRRSALQKDSRRDEERGRKSTGPVVDEKNKRAEGRKLKRGQQRRKRGQQ